MLTFSEGSAEPCRSDTAVAARRRLSKRVGGQETERAGRLAGANPAWAWARWSAALDGARVAQGRRDSVAGATIGSVGSN